MAVQQNVLTTMPYFTGLSAVELEAVRRLIVEKTIEKGQLVVMEDEPPAAVYFIVSGAVKLFKTSSDGKEQIFHIACPGESFNEVSVFDAGVNPFSVQTMGAATFYEIGKSDFMAIVQRYPRVASNVIQVLSTQIRRLTALVEDFSFKNVIGRVAKILLDSVLNKPCDHPRLTQQEMAAMAGTSREVVGRSLKSLEDSGAIRIDHHRIIVQNRQKLEDMTG